MVFFGARSARRRGSLGTEGQHVVPSDPRVASVGQVAQMMAPKGTSEASDSEKQQHSVEMGRCVERKGLELGSEGAC